MTATKKKLFSFQALLIVFFLFCLCCILPVSRNLIIILMEHIIGRGLKDMTKWNAVITGTMSFFATLSVFGYFLLYIEKGKYVLTTFLEKINEVFFSKKAAIQLSVLFGIYLLCYFTLIRANYDFQDDIKRIISGHKSWVGASRYISEALAVFLHTNFYLNDIAPIPQLLALAILTISSYMLAHIVTDGNITKLSLVISVLMGTCPFYFENMSYKFDAPYMALAVFFGILPFLFTRDILSYVVISFISLFFVCSAYQAGNSIYIILSIFISARFLLQKDAKNTALKFLGISVACYLISLLFFKIFVMIPTEATIDERNTHVGSVQTLLQLVWNNFRAYNSAVVSNYGNIWIRFFTLITILLFPFVVVKKSNKNRNLSILTGVFSLILMYVLSFGAYLVIGSTLISDRAFMGFDTLIALIAIFDTTLLTTNSKRPLKVITVISVCCLLYGFCIFSTIKGNLYVKQNDYQKFRYTILLNDMSHIINPSAHNEAYVVGHIGPATSAIMEHKNYGLNIGGHTSGWTSYIIQDWNMNLDFLSKDSYEDKFNQQTELKNELESMPLLVSAYYHDIYGKNNRYLIRLKNPQVKDYEFK